MTTYFLTWFIRLFADDTILYVDITNHSDCQALQSDFSKLESWESEWLMAFNPEKYEVIRITKKLYFLTINFMGLKPGMQTFFWHRSYIQPFYNVW